MNARGERASLWRRQARIALVVAKKDMLVYYLQPPVLIFGVIFPVFFFLAFAVGRPVPVATMVPGMLAMALFFTASAVGPLVTPWERRARTYERLATSPASLEAILAGDVLAGAVIGAVVSVVPLVIALAAMGSRVVGPAALVLGILLGALAFASLGVLLASPATESPSQVMMLSNLVRLPLIFVSGVFIPVAQMPPWGRWLAPLSPLSYCVDLIRGAFGEPRYFPLWLDVAALAGFAAALFAAARLLHRLVRSRGA